MVVLAGEPGIGKTALITEVLARSEGRGYRPLSGCATELERDVPFGVFTEALDRELRSLERGRLDFLEQHDRVLLASIFPSLAPSAGGTPLPTLPDKRHGLLSAMRALLELLADDRPLVVALDDLHWADAESVDLICHLLYRGIANPSLLLLASRPTQSEPRLHSALAEADRHGTGLRMELGPLTEAEAHELLDAEIEPALQEALYHQSGGNPFYLEQLAAASRRGRTLEAPVGGVGGAGVPAAVVSAIRSELEALSARARTLLRGAATLGEPFEPDLAAETAGMPEKAALRALDELVESDLIRSAEAPSRFRFRHPIVHRAVYEACGAGWRLAAHGRAAAALEARGAPVVARAHHVDRSARFGDEAAAAVLIEAGQETVSHAPASAARWFDAALRLTPKRADNGELRFGLLAQRAAALGVAGSVAESRKALGEFLRLSPPRPSQMRLQCAVLAAILDELLGNHAEGRRLLEVELSRLAEQDGPEAAELKRELAFTCFYDADWRSMARWARQSLEAACRGMVRVGALCALALAELGLDHVDKAKRSVSEAAELFDHLADEEVAAHHPGIAIWLGWAEICIERFDDAIRHAERSIAISRARGQRHMTVGLLVVQAEALAWAGRDAELAAVAEAVTEAALLCASDLFLSWAMRVRSQASLRIGDLHAAVRFGERSAGAAAATGSPLSSLARVQLASALLEVGEPERCCEQLVGIDGEPDLPPFPLHEALAYELLVRAEIALGRVDRAEEFAERADQTAQRLGIQLPVAQARRALAVVFLERGEAQTAKAEALASCEAAEQAGAPVEAARGRILAARALVAAGDRTAAIAALESAHEQLVSCGASRYSDEAAQQLRKLGRTVPRTASGRQPGSNVFGLTQRELEVMELVAAGRTNREIADTLFLSVRTVDRHVSRIFDKLDVNTRAAAASAFERARSRSSF